MNLIKTILAKYTGWLWGIVSAMGPWGVFFIATVDSAFMGIPMDPVVATYVHLKPHLFWMYALLASAGSALGSIVIYGIGYKGEEVLLEKRIPKGRLDKLRASFERHEFLAVMVPAMLPPPTPFKLVVLTAGALKVRLRDFLLAIFLGRMARFTLLSLLVVIFGQQVVEKTKYLVKEHGPLVLGAVGVAVLLWVIFRRQRRSAAALSELAEDGK